MWPTNELGEIILMPGSGTSVVTGQLPSNFVPTDTTTGAVRVVGLSNGGGLSSIAFTTSVPLTGTTVVQKKVVTSPLTFTLTSASTGGVCIAEIIADGTNIPSFAAFEEHSSSSGYVNVAGYTNLVQFFCIGSRYYFSVSQPLTQVIADVIPPTVSSAIVAANSPTVLSVGFNETLNSSFTPVTSAFTVTGHTVSSVTLRESFVDLTVSPAFVNGEAARTVSYAQPGSNGLRDAASNLVVNFSGYSITNNAGVVVTVPAAPTGVTATAGNGQAIVNYTPGSNGGSTITGYVATSTPGGFTAGATSGAIAVTGLTNGTAYTFTVHAVNSVGNSAESEASSSVTPAVPSASNVRFGSLNNLTESGSSSPYTYTGNGTSFGTVMGGVSTTSRVVGTDGSCAVVLGAATDANHEAMLGLLAGTSPVSYTAYTYGIFAPSTGTYRVVVAGVPTDATTSVTCEINDIMRLQVVGTTLNAQVSKDSGTTWTTIFTWVAISSTAINYQIQAAKSAILVASSIVGAA